ncbi:MAG: thioredoxin domain-containing protein [Bacillota bacterium]
MAKYNHLKGESSPYLKQHEENPVDWYPWSKEAFEEAERRDVPVFLSIGYSTCHWCHVMEKESFMDKEVADIINQYFVAVKVDREERPDIDKLYMEACQAMTGSGGWPLTIFMTADKKPFYAATYLPKEDKYGRKGLLSILPEIHNLWVNQRDKLLIASNNIVSHLQKQESERKIELNEELLIKTSDLLERIYDKKYHGFGKEPKFPMPQYLIFLLHFWKENKKEQSLKMVEETLKAMRAGGIFDQLGKGFHRYSTDREWGIPHFEKMLYDQALLIYTYTEAYQAAGEKVYADVVKEIIEYLKRDMMAENGCFYSAEDADSDGVEGGYYFWSKTELQDVLNTEEYSIFLKYFELQNQNRINLTLKNIDAYNKIPEIKEKLFAIREKRKRPAKDKKILTDWNALIIAAMAKAGFVFANKEYIKIAENIVHFIFDKMNKKSGRLAHSYFDGSISETDNLNDYAYLIWGLIELHQATLKNEYLIKAEKISSVIFENFWDQKDGGFYFTAEDNDQLFIRQKQAIDSAIPSANSIACYNILKLSHLKDNFEYREKAGELLNAFSKAVDSSPANHIFLLLSYHYLQNPFTEININGDLKSAKVDQFLNSIRKRYLPRTLINYRQSNEETTFSICKDFVCGEATKNINEVLHELK